HAEVTEQELTQRAQRTQRTHRGLLMIDGAGRNRATSSGRAPACGRRQAGREIQEYKPQRIAVRLVFLDLTPSTARSAARPLASPPRGPAGPSDCGRGLGPPPQSDSV